MPFSNHTNELLMLMRITASSVKMRQNSNHVLTTMGSVSRLSSLSLNNLASEHHNKVGLLGNLDLEKKPNIVKNM